MNKMSAKIIQMFVAGALALMGFHALVWTPYYLVVSKDLVLVIGSMFSVLALLIGVAMLVGSKRAVLWAHIYLWICVLGAVAMVCPPLLVMLHIVTVAPHLVWRNVSDLFTSLILLGLLFWSRSRRFRDEPDT
jgi:hypothetical protein